MTAAHLDGRDLLRHFLATLAYRGGKCLLGAPEEFQQHDTGRGWTPLKIVAHLGDLLAWSLAMAAGDGLWQVHVPEDWDAEVARFHRGLANLDQFFASGEPCQAEVPRLLQGPLADAMTHVGQLAMLRRMTGAPLAGENYFKADIQMGRVGAEQAYPVKRPAPPSA